MSTSPETPESYVDSMPSDPDLLVELGRVVWAAARLQSGIRDAINQHNGVPSDEPFGKTLGGVLRELEGLAAKAGRKDQVEWVEKVGRPARDRRDGVLHAVTCTASDDLQAIGSCSSEKGPQRYSIPELREVTRRLIHASSTVRVWRSRGQAETGRRGVTRCVRGEGGGSSAGEATGGRGGEGEGMGRPGAGRLRSAAGQ